MTLFFEFSNSVLNLDNSTPTRVGRDQNWGRRPEDSKPSTERQFKEAAAGWLVLIQNIRQSIVRRGYLVRHNSLNSNNLG
jgi:hypothetical protein